MNDRSHASTPVVLDTNVFVGAGFNLRSSSAKIVDAVRKGQFRMIWNDATRREIERIMRQIPPSRAQGVSDLFRSEDCYAGPTHRERFGFPDPDDRKFAALAEAAGAVLVSSDDHLLNHRDRIDVPVLTPGEFWRRRSKAR